MEKIETNSSGKSHKPKPIRMTSIEESVQLSRIQQTAVTTTSAIYERKQNQKVLKVVTVAAYILFVSMAAITLSIYYVFLWVPATTNPQLVRNSVSCASDNRLIIAENVTIRLENSTQLLIDRQFFNYLFEQYQRQQEQLGNNINGTAITDDSIDMQTSHDEKGVSFEARQRMEPLPLARLSTGDSTTSSSSKGHNSSESSDGIIIITPTTTLPMVDTSSASSTSSSSSSLTPAIIETASVEPAPYHELRNNRRLVTTTVSRHHRVDEDAEEDAGEDDDDGDDEPFEASGSARHRSDRVVAVIAPASSRLNRTTTASAHHSNGFEMTDDDDNADDDDDDEDDDVATNGDDAAASANGL